MRGAVCQRAAAVRAMMFEAARFEERGHGAFAVRAGHHLHVAIYDVTRTALCPEATWSSPADPHGLAFVAHDGTASFAAGGSLTGYQRKRYEGENRHLEDLEDVQFIFHGRMVIGCRLSSVSRGVVFWPESHADW